jgi:3-keto-disaccharide hydrolase
MTKSLVYWCCLCLGVLTCATLLAAADISAPADESVLKPVGEGWRPLVNGKDLAGWKAEPGYWQVEVDGTLHGHTPGTDQHHYAFTEKSYGDFELHADVRLVGKNSGVCLRIAPQNFDVVPGYQVDMGDGYWGCLWDEGRHVKVVDFPEAEAAKLVHKDDWNHYFVRAKGHHIEAWLNGVKTIDVVDEAGLLSGPIGFQLCHGMGNMTDASFKNVVYRPIEPGEQH